MTWFWGSDSTENESAENSCATSNVTGNPIEVYSSEIVWLLFMILFLKIIELLLICCKLKHR